MARRKKKTSIAEDLFSAVSVLPWWAGVATALLLYLLCHHFALVPTRAPTNLSDFGSSVVQGLVSTIAGLCQYLLPAICLFAAAMSAWKRFDRVRLVSAVRKSETPVAVEGMTWQEFEMLVGESFRMQGYRVTETGGGGSDGGIDLVLNGSGQTLLVQCKHWKAQRVSVTVIRELLGIITAKRVDGGFVVTSGQFTAEAVAFAAQCNVTLIDGSRLHQMIRRARADKERTQMVAEAPANSTATDVGTASAQQTCPACEKPMLLRSAKRGNNAGSRFWGCSGYPACTATRRAD